MIPLPANVKLVIGLILVAGIAALQALSKVEPAWTWAGGALSVLTMLELYFTVPSTAAGRAGSDATKASAAATAAKPLGVLLMICMLSCAAAPLIVPPIVDCGAYIIEDAAKGMSFAQILADAGPKCGADASEILTVLLGSKDTRVLGSPAYAEARKLQLAAKAAP